MVAWTDCYGGETLTVPKFQCLVCDGQELVPYLSSCRDLYLGHPKIVDYVACGRCGLVQQHPVPENLGSLYSEYPVHQPKSELHEWFRRTLLKDVYFNWTALPPGARLLDFGCGDGWYLEAVRKAGINCEGYEFQADHAQQLESLLGVPVFSDVDRLIAERSAAFQAITLHNVLEHVADPRATIVKLSRLLAPDGRIFLSLPNIDSWESRLFARRWHGLDPPRHVCFPTAKTMDSIAAEAGLALESVKGAAFPNTSAASIIAVLMGRYRHAPFLLALPLGIALSRIAPTGTMTFVLGKASAAPRSESA